MHIFCGPSFKRRITSKLSVRSVRLLIIPFYMKFILAFYLQKVPCTESFHFRKKLKSLTFHIPNTKTFAF